MATGDLITTQFQFEFNGLLMGVDTAYEVVGVEGLDLPGIRDETRKRPREHGVFDLMPDLLDYRLVDLDLEVLSTSYTPFDTLADATTDFDSLFPLVFMFHDSVKKYVNCRVRKRSTKVDRSTLLGNGRVSLQFWCPDPRVYSLTQSTLSPALPAVSGGLAFPFSFNLGFGSATSSSVYATNDGNMDSYPIFTFAGPLTAPTITNITTGEIFSTASAILSGQTLTVNCADKTVLLGSTSRYSDVSSTSSFWSLVPGINEVKFGATSGSGSCTVSFYSAWSSAL